ncbi:hypothetical protein CDAR_98231 [Caerostris darwini]|uniref:Uncharacterized protein n=1 Tax=Caerostris darwini TaxID=1538125 RepID=A0AAV4UFW0_9ARAC|nr:hypothetical protein CDAR_98231 [Caerostris darwini]
MGKDLASQTTVLLSVSQFQESSHNDRINSCPVSFLTAPQEPSLIPRNDQSLRIHPHLLSRILPSSPLPISYIRPRQTEQSILWRHPLSLLFLLSYTHAVKGSSESSVYV